MKATIITILIILGITLLIVLAGMFIHIFAIIVSLVSFLVLVVIGFIFIREAVEEHLNNK